MNLQIGFVLLAPVFAGGVMMTILYRTIKGSDFLIITLFGKTYSFRSPAGENNYATAMPYIRPINNFLKDFADSIEKQIEFTPDDMLPGPAAPFLLRALQGMDYERVRLRLRVISSLNPTLNLKAEEGIIQFTYSLSSGVEQQVKLRSRFTPKGRSILLEKL